MKERNVENRLIKPNTAMIYENSFQTLVNSLQQAYQTFQCLEKNNGLIMY